ncbi:MAG: putative metallopeptidase [Planctomycetaceae bacterium]|nr:hypothetical protein [Planctomycetaceae bacterium]
MARKRKPKVVQVELIPREHEGKVRQPYQIMEALVDKHHDHLESAKIALAWRKGWKPNPDGHLQLGKAKKSTDLDREMHVFDFVILLNFEVWNKADFTREQMEALIDHELCHCDVSKDKTDEVKMDSLGRPIWRIRKHDVEEFQEVIARHGAWTLNLQSFAQMLDQAPQPLLETAGAAGA